MDDVQFKAGNLSGRARIFVAGFPRYILLSCNGRKLRIGYSFTYDILLFVQNIHYIKVSLSWNRKSAYSCYAYTNTSWTEGDERCRIVWGSFGKERHQHDDNKEHRFSWMNVTVLWNVMPGYLLDIISTNILFQFSVGIWFLRNVRRYLLVCTTSYQCSFIITAMRTHVTLWWIFNGWFLAKFISNVFWHWICNVIMLAILCERWSKWCKWQTIG